MNENYLDSRDKISTCQSVIQLEYIINKYWLITIYRFSIQLTYMKVKKIYDKNSYYIYLVLVLSYIFVGHGIVSGYRVHE